MNNDSFVLKERILILGSIASGKTTLARRLATELELPVIHVDSLEFNADLSKKNIEDVRKEIKIATDEPKWILDGYGPLDLLPLHLKNANTIIFLDFSFSRSLFWLIKRQLKILFHRRRELPSGANEWQWIHFNKMWQSLKKQHRLMNPELRKILNKPEIRSKVVHIETMKQWDLLAINRV